jgi:signal transduction histidine kinase/DNA-binding response OmpR family regulator
VYPDAAAAERWLADDQGVAAQGVATYPDVEYRDAAGDRHWLHIKKRPLASMPGQPPLVLAVGTDVTERKLAELAVAERLAFQDVVARTLAVIVGCDRESFAAAMKEALGNVAVVCRAQTAVIYQLDWPQQRIVQVHFWRDVPAVRPTTFPLSLISPALPALVAGEAYGYDDPRTLPPHATPMRDVALSLGIEGGLFVPVVRDGILWGALGLYRRQPGLIWSANDEAVLRTLADILIGAHARHEAEEQVVAAMQAAQEGNRAKSEFLANMSHEIRTPLNAVIGLADLLQRLDPTPQQQHYLQMVNSAGQTLLSLINDVLDLSRIEAGEVVLESSPVSLVEIAGEVVNVLALQAERKGLELILRVDPEVPEPLLGDPLRLRQILMNLVGNAIKFTEHGLVELAITRQLDGIRVQVQDSGIGIPAAKLREIFESFTQADASHTRRYGGTGLGLAICRRLVNLMGGQIEAQSEDGRGSIFTADLPLYAAEGARPAVDSEPALAGRRVLVALGPATTRVALVDVLRALGMTAETAAGGAEAAERLRRESWDVITLDSRASDDDFTRCEDAMRLESSPPRLLVLAGLDTESRGTALVRAGRARPVARPVDPGRLRRALLDVLAPREATAATPAASTTGPAPLIRVLLAEDNPINQKVATSLLQTLGCAVTVAADGRQAVAAAATGAFDLVLMDCQMPEMDGLEATRRLRALPAPLGTVPVIAITANVLGEHRQACFAAGMDDFVSKPISREALRRTLEKWAVSHVLDVA